MGESFFGLNIAIRGLYTAQRGLNTVNHNLNNANTPGYSRQIAVQAASRPAALYDGTGMVGTGSDVVAVDRIRDEYLDFKYWSEGQIYGEWGTKGTLMSDVETTFNEPSDNGFSTIMDDFYGSLQELSKDPASKAIRSVVREKGVTLTKYFNSMAVRFEKQQADINTRVRTKVEEINATASQIQQLNKQIYASELDGSTANDLRDQRTLLIDKLSNNINIDVNEVVAGKLPSGKDDKHLVITISGKALVDHFNISTLSVTQRSIKMNPDDIDNIYDVGWADGNSLDIRSGELKGYIDVRDGNEGVNGSPIYKGIPYYEKKINQFARTFAMSFNEGFIDVNSNGVVDFGEDRVGHADGYTLDAPAAAVTPSGIRFFTMTGNNGMPLDKDEFLNGAVTNAEIYDKYKNINAKNLSVSDEVINSPEAISVSDAPAQTGNIVNLNALLAARHDTHMFSEGGPEDFMKSLIASLGIDSQMASRLSDSHESMVRQVDTQRMADSGVSIDEEMANLIKYQHAYNASAKMIETMSEIYDTLINRIGL